jgi:protein-disulfide isomerase
MLWAAVAASALGIALAAYSVQISFKIAGQGIVESSGCSMGEFVNCDLALASSYAELLGIPVAGWGLAFYVFAGLGALLGLFSSNRRSAGGWIAFAWLLSIGAVLFSLVKAFHLYQLGVLCIVCLGMYLVNLALLFLLAAGLNAGGMGALLTNWLASARGAESPLPFDAAVPKWALVAVVVFGLGFVVMKRQVDAVESGDDINMELALAAHFRQTPVEVRVDPDAPLWGSDNGTVQVVEFADFQCPACQISAFHLRTPLFEFRDRLSFRFMNFPLDSAINEEMRGQVHTQAGAAAAASVCAQRFGDFWDYHDDLFRNQVSLGPQLYSRLAQDRDWSVDEFEACMAAEDVYERIRSDIRAGRDAGLSSTPTIYINGRRVAYWQNTEFIREVIREELRQAS